jgi:hypothetical protein
MPPFSKNGGELAAGFGCDWIVRCDGRQLGIIGQQLSLALPENVIHRSSPPCRHCPVGAAERQRDKRPTLSVRRMHREKDFARVHGFGRLGRRWSEQRGRPIQSVECNRPIQPSQPVKRVHNLQYTPFRCFQSVCVVFRPRFCAGSERSTHRVDSASLQRCTPSRNVLRYKSTCCWWHERFFGSNSTLLCDIALDTPYGNDGEKR